MDKEEFNKLLKKKNDSIFEFHNLSKQESPDYFKIAEAARKAADLEMEIYEYSKTRNNMDSLISYISAMSLTMSCCRYMALYRGDKNLANVIEKALNEKIV